MNVLRIVLVIFILFIGSVSVFTQEYIADYKVAKESVLRSIPDWAITAAKNNLHIMYCGTSHSSQTADGLRGLMEYKTGDDSKFAVTFNGTPVIGSLDIHYRPTSPVNVYSTGTDLSHDSLDSNGHTGYYRATVAYLDHPDHADVNVVMWSWCSIQGHYVQRYLDNFAELIDMYRAGGSKGRTAANEVKFVFMTGYARGTEGDTPEPPYTRTAYQNHKRIVDYCRANNYFCLDYWSQDTYDYETDFYKPYESGNNNVQHKAYFDSHTEGVHWFATRSYSSGYVKWPAHCEATPQHITSNRRAYAAWWIWARLAGWSGSSKSIEVTSPNGGENLNKGTLSQINWNSNGLSNNIKITIWQNGSLMGLVANNIDPTSGAYDWNVGDIAGGSLNTGSGYTIKIKEKSTAIADTSDSSFSILAPPTLTLTSPNGGESFDPGTIENITWDSTGISGNVKITLWQNGSRLGTIVSSISASLGTYAWTVGNYNGGIASSGSAYTIKIKEIGTTVADMSDGSFTINDPTINITTPNGGENLGFGKMSNITWNSSGISGNVKITLWQNGSRVGTIVSGISASLGTYSWTVGTYIGGTAPTGSGYIIKIKEIGTTVSDISNSSFSIVTPTISLTSPNGGETLTIGSPGSISWSNLGLNGNVKITLWQNGSRVGTIVSGISASLGTYSWTIGAYIGGVAPSGSGYMIKIKEIGTSVADFSDSNFSMIN